MKRPFDIVARYGGEEFVIILPGISSNGAYSVAETIRTSIESLNFQVNGTRIPVTISIGIASIIPDTSDEPDVFFATADSALYTAKQTGRNRCYISDDSK
ncbi:GGDEF domain-containing protein [bacterium]|nr:GGDEF domain-containing protein [bacterium]